MKLVDGRTAQQWRIWIWLCELASKEGNLCILAISRYDQSFNYMSCMYSRVCWVSILDKKIVQKVISVTRLLSVVFSPILNYLFSITIYLNKFRWKVNCRVPSKPFVISSTGGHVARLIFSRKWQWKSWETRYQFACKTQFSYSLFEEVKWYYYPSSLVIPFLPCHAESLHLEEVLCDL